MSFSEITETPLEFLLSIMRDNERPDNIRIAAAKAAAPYMHKRLTQMDGEGDDISHESALDEFT